MRLPEQKLYDWVQRKIGHTTFLERVENRVKKDTPDLYVVTKHGQALRPRPLQGWIELKVLEAFPARATTTVKLHNWTTGQRYWTLRHRQHGGHCWIVVAVEAAQKVYVFDAAELAQHESAWTAQDWGTFGQVLDRRNASTTQVLDALAECVL